MAVDRQTEKTPHRRSLCVSCPSDSCESSCKNGADYLVEMREFVEAYLEFQMTQQEYNCEKVEENCDCENANDDEACLANCYAEAGLDYCQEDEEQQNYNNNNEEFEIDRFLECERLGDDDDYATPVYVGPYCANSGKSIYLGTFSDRQCTQQTATSNFKSYAGYDLPYSSESIVANDCISCREPSEYDDDYNQDQQDEDDVVEICEELYQRSAKCERNLEGVDTKYVGGCDYMYNFLPKFERLVAGKSSSAKTWAWVFAITTVLFAAYAFFLYRKVLRAKVNLGSQ